MIQGIFYARFLPHQGTKIVAQSPPGCVVADPSSPDAKAPLIDLDTVREYIIPRKAFFGRFMTVRCPDNKYSLLGFPVSIAHERYHRNEFIFNFGLVVESDCDLMPYERLVRRLAVTFAEMERQGDYLSSDSAAAAVAGRRPIESLLEIVKEDLNNYGECMIPVDEANTLNMKLFPHHAAPAPVRGWHVPVPKMKLAEIVDPTWDLTLQRLLPHIDGVNDVRRIAWLADVSLPLTRTALQHLLYYDTILLLDIFLFAACYAPRPGLDDFVANRDGIVDECAAYTALLPPPPPPPRRPRRDGDGGGDGDGDGDGGDGGDDHGDVRPTRVVSNYQLIKLMTTFCVGRSVMEWIYVHRNSGFDVLRHVDVRRLVQFGVIKGLLYRVHKYVVSMQYLALLATGRARAPSPDGHVSAAAGAGGGGGAAPPADALLVYTDGCHCFDQIITEQNLTDGEIMEKLKSFETKPADLSLFYR